MNIAEFAIKKKVTMWLIIILLIGGGLHAYETLGRYEDPEFTIKDAKVVTKYPGATPREVELEVTEKLEVAIQQMGQVKWLKSISAPGGSEITVKIKDHFDKYSLPQVWDELRRKVTDAQKDLPPGAGPSLVVDDFGDVFGILFALTSDGFSYKELKEAADYIRRELLLVPGVAKVQLAGDHEQAIFVNISRAKIAQLGISLEEIYTVLEQQNIVVRAGEVPVGDEYIRIEPTGAIDSERDIGNLLIKSSQSGSLIYLSDIAEIERGYTEVPEDLVYFNGLPAITIGVSILSGGNVVKIGEEIEKKLAEFEPYLPIGMELDYIYAQPEYVAQSVDGFLVNLIEALAIVIVVLFIFMGVRSGIIIASILLLTVLGTLAFMQVFAIDLQRISLGALIIALGMLVDNAIVVVEGILIKVQQGVNKLKASVDVLAHNMWPLLGATIVGILAFAPIGLSTDSTGEYAGSLFYVILISLLLSWLLGITVGPLFADLLLKEEKNTENDDPYRGFIYQAYRGLLATCLRLRYFVVLLMIGLLAASIYGFSYVKDSFFPNSTTPMFYVDYWRSEGSDPRATQRDMREIQQHIKTIAGIKDVTVVTGQGALRFMLVYEPESKNRAYGQFIIKVDDYRHIDSIAEQVQAYIGAHYPESQNMLKKIRLGPGSGAKVEARFSGKDPDVLRELSEKTKAIYRATPQATDIRDDWRHRVKVIKPIYAESQARATGISRADLSAALEMAFSGKQVGLYREKDILIPIISRPPDEERLNVKNLQDIQIWSPVFQKAIPISQVISDYETVWDESVIRRRDRKRTITVQTDPAFGEASTLFNHVRPLVEAIPLQPGYQLVWGGEYENSSDAQKGLASSIPMGILAMIAIVVMLFNAIRQPLIIWLTVPLSFIGVTVGLLATDQPFDFMALLGFLSLTGMLIKNSIVLIEQIDIEIESGTPPYQAILDSSVSRMRPVSLAALTTVLGMIPLLQDAFFIAMSVVIMFGLTFATVLTLIFVPVLYSIFFRIKPEG